MISLESSSLASMSLESMSLAAYRLSEGITHFVTVYSDSPLTQENRET